jgi:tRNA-dihydrouridine synthase B
MTKKPNFHIGTIPIFGDLILAPMDGLTDVVFRGICRQLGSAMTVSEFINTIDVVQKRTHFIPRTAFTDNQRPFALQLLDDQPERLLDAAHKLVQQIKPDMIDINLGCQSKNVTSRGAGAALMKTPSKIARIFLLMVKNFDIPITGKIRLGWDENHLNYLEVAKAIQDSGGAMVAIHGRTRRQGYKGKANWVPIAEMKEALQIPVIGNGDVKTVEDIQAIKSLTGCDAVMIGRGAIGNPWIFSRMDRDQVPPQDVKTTILTHLKSMLDFYGPRGTILFRKFLKRYLASYSIPREEMLKLLTTTDPDEIKAQVQKQFNNMNHPNAA